MKILALEKGIPDVPGNALQPHLKAEGARIWELIQSGVIREIYFQDDKKDAILILECNDKEEAQATLNTLPLVKEGFITFKIIPLVPYDGLSRLFQEE